MKGERRIPIRNHRARRLPPGSSRVAVDRKLRAEVTVVVRSRGSEAEWQQLVANCVDPLPKDRRYLTRAEFGRAWGASPHDLQQVRAYTESYRLTTVSADAWRRCVVVSGTLAQLEEAFGVEFIGVEHALGTFHSHRKQPQVAKSIHAIVEAVLGLDNLPSATPHVAAVGHRRRSAGTQRTLRLPDLRKAYGFPPRMKGKGECVAVIELGGGLHQSDYLEYFKRVGLSPPKLRKKAVSGATNEPAPRWAMKKLADAIATGGFPPAQGQTITGSVSMDQLAMWTWEVAMDLQIIGTLAPDVTLLLMMGRFDDQSQYHAITSVLADARNAPSVLSCSWSLQEMYQTPKLMPVLDRWFQAAAVLGVTVCFSAGDAGDGTMFESGNEQLTFVVNFPGTSPYVLACGGTTLDVDAGTEVAWHQSIDGGVPMAGGGGFSEVFPLPPWQVAAGIDSAGWIPEGASSGSGRGVPDVAAKADLDPSFCVIAGGSELPAGGTSAAAPLWAALTAVLNEAMRCPSGLLGALLYEGGLSASLRDITRGNIGHLRAKKGWDPATGWGSPHGDAMLQALNRD